MGTGVAWAENLSFEGESLTWDTQTESFTNEDKAAAAFAPGDNVSFSGESAVTLGEDISAGAMTIEKGADVTIDLDVFELTVDRIELSGLLDMGYSLNIGAGTTLAMNGAGAVLDSNLILGEKGVLSVTGSSGSLNGHSLTLQEGASLILTGAVISRETTDADQDGELSLIVTPTGDGKTYTLLTGVDVLVDKTGNALTVGEYEINEIFDSSLPGSGFWIGGTLVYAADGTLTLVRHNEMVKDALDVTTRQTGSVDYSYYAGISFKNLTTNGSDGGAIDGDNITLSNNGSVVFSGNTDFSPSPIYSNGYGGAIDGYTIELCNNGSVVFDGNTAYGSDFVFGGAIYGRTIELCNNGSVVFSGNKASSSDAYGGAICGARNVEGTITLSSNGSVVFEGNTVSSSSDAYGGAIYGGYSSSTIMLSNNGSVVFSGNTASSSSDAYGGAICGYGDITLSNNGSVVFEGNKASSSSSPYSADGGAICGYGDITLSNNGSVVFSGNTASSSYACGGAICVGYTITLSNNGSVVFEGNKSSTGGAIGGSLNTPITLSNNGSVVFSRNTASYYYSASGGAIYGGSSSTITLSNNGSVTFSGNTVSGRYVDGGAICGHGGITLSNNGSVVFEGNTASGISSAYGGAIYGGSSSTITLSNNGSVVFEGNTASGISSTYGGAIHKLSGGGFAIQNNQSVVFKGNYTLNLDTYTLNLYTLRLQSIYAVDSDDADKSLVVHFSAPGNSSIEFRDTIHIGVASNSSSAFHLNDWYVAENGEQIAQTGDIIFTGADANAEYLQTILHKYGFRVSDELMSEYIAASRTSVINGVAQLHDGRLIIRDGAVLEADGIKVLSSASRKSTPSLWLDYGELTSLGSGRNALSFASGTAFALSGQNAARNTAITFSSGCTFSITLDSSHAATAALTLTNSTLELPDSGTITLQLNAGETLFSENSYKLLSGIAKPSDWDEKSITVTSGTDGWTVSFDDLEWIGDTLWLNNNIEITPNVPPAPAPEFNPNLDRNQQEVYDTVKDIMADGNPGGVLGLLGQEIVGSRDEAALKRALDEISGREYATIMSSQIEGNLGHLRRLRAAAGMGTPLGEYVTFSCCYPSNKGVDKSDNKGATVMMAPSPVLDSRRIRAGVSAFHEQAELDADSNGEGFERSETGAQLTMEYLVSNDFVFGMGLSHSRTKLTPTFGKRRDEDNTHFDLFGVYRSGRWSSTTALGVGLHQHELGRTVAGMQTEAEADGLSVNFLQELAYCVYADEEQGLEVFGAVESSFNKVDSFSESGAGNASLLVDEQDAWATDVTLGLRYNHALPSLGKAPAGVFTLQGGVVASLGDTNADATVHFAGAPGYAFKQSAAERNRWGYSVGASVNLPVSASTAVFGTAEAVLRNDSYTVDAQVGVKMAF